LLISVPVFDSEGAIKTTIDLSPIEAQHLLQFALNFLVASGMTVNYALGKKDTIPTPTTGMQ
jgi:hypothetical protein